MTTKNKIHQSVRKLMDADRKLAGDTSVKCCNCGADCQSTFMGKKMCSECISNLFKH